MRVKHNIAPRGVSQCNATAIGSSVPRRVMMGYGWLERRVFHTVVRMAYIYRYYNEYLGWIIASDIIPIGVLSDPDGQPSAARAAQLNRYENAYWFITMNQSRSSRYLY